MLESILLTPTGGRHSGGIHGPQGKGAFSGLHISGHYFMWLETWKHGNIKTPGNMGWVHIPLCTEILKIFRGTCMAYCAAGAGVGGQLLAGRVLRLQLTSEEDPYFLHTMEVSEEDFQTLKADQAILVDFGAFPQEVRVVLT